MSCENNYDELLYPILCSEGNIDKFFDKVFDFLFRRTDFFKIKFSESSLGLVVGEAENIVKNAFIKYMDQAVIEAERHREMTFNEPVVQDYVSEEIVETTILPELKQSLAKNVECPKKVNECEVATNVKEDKNKPKEKKEKVYVMEPECYNGARYENYSWSQSLKEIDVLIKVPKEVTTGKQVSVSIQQTHISSEVKIDGISSKLKEGDLSWKINVAESTWTLVPHEHIHIHLQKLQDRWWNALFIDEPKIDVKAIDASMPYEDLDEDTRAKLQELMFNEHQKRLGKPTAQQLKIQDALKEAWDCEGSPFKGQLYDPSILNIQDSGNTF